MSELAPLNPIEQLFVERAGQRLPIDEAQIERHRHGALSYFWPSPCNEIEGLWVYLMEQEIMLSTKIAHTHIDRYRFRPEMAPELVEARHIVDEGIAAIERILTGQTTFSISYDPEGQRHSAGIGRLATMAEEIAYSREVFGDGITQRTWTWFGEVTGEERASEA